MEAFGFAKITEAIAPESHEDNGGADKLRRPQNDEIRRKIFQHMCPKPSLL